MNREFGRYISKGLQDNLALYFVITLFFSIGLAAGAFTIKALGYNQKQELLLYLNNFFQILGKEEVKNSAIFFQAVRNNAITIIIIWLLGITVVGIPITLIISSFRGFILGFTISFLIQGLGWKGILFTFIALVPQNIIYIPCLLIVAVTSLNFSLKINKRQHKKNIKSNIMDNILSYSLSIASLFAIMCIGSAVEAYISPFLLRNISSYMIIK